jgi:hypothetical protein
MGFLQFETVLKEKPRRKNKRDIIIKVPIIEKMAILRLIKSDGLGNKSYKKPPTRGPTTAPRLVMVFIRPIFRPRCPSPNSPIYDREIGVKDLAPAPRITRRIMKKKMLLINGIITATTPVIKQTIRNPLIVPFLSERYEKESIEKSPTRLIIIRTNAIFIICIRKRSLR